ncbi:unnamed protein product [Acidithrix sp. C25]|nr:unnamed protein product [Acidithrix sp. C25]
MTPSQQGGFIFTFDPNAELRFWVMLGVDHLKVSLRWIFDGAM